METLILACGTGGGHFACARAIAQAAKAAGHQVTIIDPYTLMGAKTAQHVNHGYIRLVQTSPKGFGFVYQLGEQYRKLKVHSPVYWLNRHRTAALAAYLANHHFDAIISTHLFASQLVSAIANTGQDVPTHLYVATDYVCIPFTEELRCDAYVIGATALRAEFERYGIERAKIFPLGIPVAAAFTQRLSPTVAKQQLGLDVTKTYWLMSAGSLGGHLLTQLLAQLRPVLAMRPEITLLVLTGSEVRRPAEGKIVFIPKTNDVPTYLWASEVLLTKPGGLSSTEALVTQTPLIHLQPIPGCEPHNRDFFVTHGLSWRGETAAELAQALAYLADTERCKALQSAQQQFAKPDAAKQVIALAQCLVKRKT